MFISAFILVICIAAMIQFAVFSWRAGLLRTIATEPVGDAGRADGRDLPQSAEWKGLR